MTRPGLPWGHLLRVGISVVAFDLLATAVAAGTSWTDWTSATQGSSGSADGVLHGVAVSYTGEVIGAVIDGSSRVFQPPTSFTGGTVTTSPDVVGDVIRLRGLYAVTNRISFATPVTNPVLAIYSLGSAATLGSMTFDATPTLEAGGPSVGEGGQSVTVTGNTVSGYEGNGVVQFTGTFSSISWTITYEPNGGWCGITFGVAGVTDTTCRGLAGTIVGTDGPDLLMGTPGPDVMVGLDGNDVIYGLDGNDTMCGGDGRDVLVGGNGSDRLYGGQGPDTLLGEGGRDWLYGEYADDYLSGGDGDDDLSGGVGSDLCDGGPEASADTAVSSCEQVLNVP